MSRQYSPKKRQKLKDEYVTTNISYRQLADKYGVSYSTVKTWMKVDKWAEERAAFRQRVENLAEGKEREPENPETESENSPQKPAKKSSKKTAGKPQAKNSPINEADKKAERAAKRERKEHERTLKSVEPVELAMADRAIHIRKTTNRVLAKIDQLVDLDEPMAPRDLKAISGTLLDIKQLWDIKSDADQREQEARIKQLEKSLDDKIDNSIIIRWADPPSEEVIDLGI